MCLKTPSGGRLLVILNASEGCSRSSAVCSVSQGIPVPLKSLLRDHDGGGWEEGQNPGATSKIKSPGDLTVVQAAPATVAPSHLPTTQWASWKTPCAMGLGRGAVGKCPFYFLQARVIWTVVSTEKKKKLKPLSKLSNCLAFVLPSVTHPRALVEKVFSLQN